MMPAFRKHQVLNRHRLFDGFFKLDELLVWHEPSKAPHLSEPIETKKAETRLVLERGDAAAVLLYNRDRNQVVLVRQFRAPTLGKGQGRCHWPGDGWVLETVAGMIPDNEYAQATAVRETMEETGYQIDESRLRPIATFFSSAGGTSEKIFLYYAEVLDSDRKGNGGGTPGEDIEVVEIDPAELFEKMDFESKNKEGGSIEDAKLMIAAQWLQKELQKTERVPLRPGPPVRYRMAHNPDLIIGYIPGPITGVRDIDIWVNSENEDMIMDRFIGRSISANIRHLGAEKDHRKNVREDTIANALKRALGGHLSVKVGTVIETPPGALDEYEVRRLFHVATVRGEGAGGGVRAARHDLYRCTKNVLIEAEENNQKLLRWWWRGKDKSILFPMMGAGDGGLQLEEVAPELIQAAREFLHSTPTPSLCEIYFLAFTARHRRACANVLDNLCRSGELLPPSADVRSAPVPPPPAGDPATVPAEKGILA